VLIEVLGAEFDGVLGGDCFSADRRYRRGCGVVLQFCPAHLIGDVKFLATLPDARDRAYGEALRGPFAVIHRRSDWTQREFGLRLGAARGEVLRRGTRDVPAARASTDLAKRPEAPRGQLFLIPHGARRRADEQPGRAGDPVRGHRPADHAEDAGGARRPVVRADLDGDGDVQSTGTVGGRVSEGRGSGVVPGG
jgi:hypothetical protein